MDIGFYNKAICAERESKTNNKNYRNEPDIRRNYEFKSKTKLK